jgi:hypothetical protein
MLWEAGSLTGNESTAQMASLAHIASLGHKSSLRHSASLARLNSHVHPASLESLAPLGATAWFPRTTCEEVVVYKTKCQPQLFVTARVESKCKRHYWSRVEIYQDGSSGVGGNDGVTSICFGVSDDSTLAPWGIAESRNKSKEYTPAPAMLRIRRYITAAGGPQ